MDAKMNTKNLLVSFCTIAIALFLVGVVSAAGEYTIDKVEVNGIEVSAGSLVAVDAENTVEVEVWFSSNFDDNLSTADSDLYDSHVTVEAELDTGKKKVNDVSSPMVIEDGEQKKVTLTLEAPYELKDELSKVVELTIEIDGEKYEATEDYQLKLKREVYKADIMSIEVSQSAVAGELLPIDVVLKNIGYNELEDLYVTVSISALGLEEKEYFGDLVAVEDDDNEDAVKGRVYLRIPYDAQEGIYTIEAEVSNDDLDMAESEEIIIKNDFSEGNIIVNSFRKVAATGQDVEYSLMLINPTNQLKVYHIVTEPACEVNCNLYTKANTAIVAVPAGTSKTVTVTANAAEKGEYTFNVNVLSGSKLEGIVTFSLGVEGGKTNPVAVLTVILAIIFVVLLVVLIVLLGKKPQKAEEFGESYY